uniref:MD-2-related lipid-recognition domain-containing protein n=1 Tax=Panagrolaimus sp. JU765 TaxID=591449 RepID=A0AC34Q5S7_9BILA
MAALFKAFVLICIIGTTLAAFEPLDYKDCKSTFKITKVEADGCPKESQKCVFKRGSKPTIKIAFVPDRDLPSMKATVRSKMSGGSAFTTFNLSPDDTYEYVQSVEIADTYPVVDDVQVNWALTDADESTKEVCIVFLAKVIE